MNMALSTSLVLASLLATSVGSNAVPSNHNIMRRHEAEDMQMFMDSEGNVDRRKQGLKNLQQSGVVAAEVGMHFGEGAMTVASKEKVDSCEEDYIQGTGNSNNCSDLARHTNIEDEGDCEIAAGRLGLPKGSPFRIPDSVRADKTYEQDYFPKGCFHGKCDSSCTANDCSLCAFYNEAGQTPQNPVGTPICTRPRFMNGTKDTTGKNDGDCPDGYKVVDNPQFCRTEITGCTTHGEGGYTNHPFCINSQNNSKRHDFPHGCFIADDSLNEPDHVFFNDKVLNSAGTEEASFATPSNPKGTPVCWVKQQTSCTASACTEVDTAYPAQDANTVCTATQSAAAPNGDGE